MRFKEFLLLESEKPDKELIEKWLGTVRPNGKFLTPGKLPAYSISKDGYVNIPSNIDLTLESIPIPFKLGKVKELNSNANHLDTFENLPSESVILRLSDNRIKSLVGIEKVIKKTSNIWLSSNPVIQGGIGLLLIQDLKYLDTDMIKFHTGYKRVKNWHKAMMIIEKYLGKPNKIFECQSELIDAGLDAYAKL